jgi:hypothetical protein
MNLQTQRRLRFLTEVTGIFEKEILILLYYLVFSAIAGAFPESLVQAIFFIAGTAFQVWLKIARKGGLWRHYTLLGFYLTGTLVNHGKNTLGNGLLVFLFIVSSLSLLYELYRGRVKRPVLATAMGIAHSAVVFTAFPLLYSLFLLNKKGISLAAFFRDQEHFLVFLGYSTFYLSVVVNKQLHAIQNALLRKWCRMDGSGFTIARAPAGKRSGGSSTHPEGG